MSHTSVLAVRGAAGLAVGISAATLVLSGRAGEPLPVGTINVAVIAGGAAGMALVLHSRTPDNNLWRVLLVIALVGPLAVAVFATARHQREVPVALHGALWLADPLLLVPWLLFIGLFPDGHRPIAAWPAIIWSGALLVTTVSVLAWLSAPDGGDYPIPGHLPAAELAIDGSLHTDSAQVASALTGLFPLVAAWCLLHRYRRAGPVMQQQIRLGAAGLMTCVVIELGLRTLPFVDHRPIQFAAAVIAVGVGALGVAAGLLRWRLWIVDQALPRAVVFGACSAAFTALIAAGALIVTGSVGTSQVQAALFAAIIVTVLVQGYSRRLEPWVRRLVYGDRPGGFAVLIGLADDLATLDEPRATARIADAARLGLAVPWAAVWAPTARQGVFRLATSCGELLTPPEVVHLERRDHAPEHDAGPPEHDAVPPEHEEGPPERREQPPARTWLLPTGQLEPSLPADTAAVSLLSTGVEPWGLLAVGQRRGEPLTDGDLELLTVITREADLAHVNRRLLDEVAVSLDQLQTRARQLTESRQRLVAAQDEERRRIERDLHDGAQHELITLASQLRQLARSEAVRPGLLDHLAEQAERAVFSLQDLARGIYPSVLTDHGVAAAIRSFAGRLPLTVTLDTAPDTVGRRWPADLEVALYFVAVESLGNSRKHAAASATTVTLAERDGDVVLEVHDDGAGFDPRAVRAGSGLQHMADRMAALEGTLVVNSRPGGGTWVTARAPAAARSTSIG